MRWALPLLTKWPRATACPASTQPLRRHPAGLTAKSHVCFCGKGPHVGAAANTADAAASERGPAHGWVSVPLLIPQTAGESRPSSKRVSGAGEHYPLHLRCRHRAWGLWSHVSGTYPVPDSARWLRTHSWRLCPLTETKGPRSAAHGSPLPSQKPTPGGPTFLLSKASLEKSLYEARSSCLSSAKERRGPAGENASQGADAGLTGNPRQEGQGPV